jgi:hypothetical protein
VWQTLVFKTLFTIAENFMSIGCPVLQAEIDEAVVRDGFVFANLKRCRT